MFNKLTNIKKYSKEIISINDLVDIVKNNPQQDLINKIRSVEYKSKEYNNLKLKVNAITPHGIFSSLKNKDLINLSGYLYYDIDGFDTEINLNDTKQKLIDTNIVSFLCKSVGGKGLSFLIKLNDTINISNDTFIDTYNYVRELLIEKGFNIDTAANGLVRKMIISSDSDFYFNNKVSLLIDKVSYKNYIENLNRSNVIKVERNRSTRSNDTFLNSSNVIKEERNRSTRSNDTFSYSLFTLIDKDKLDLIEETPYTNKKDYDIQEIDYYKIFIPKEIKDGDKHRLYVRIMNALYYLNKNITMNEVYSYLYYINLKAANKMNDLYLRKYVYNIFSNIEKNGVRIKLRKKKIHIDDKYDKNQKRIMGAKINGKLRQNESIKLIQDAIDECAKQNIVPTRKKVAEMTGLGIATVKRNWNKEINDMANIEMPLDSKYEDIQEEREYKLRQLTEIEEDLFWENWNPKKVSKDYDEVVDKDFGESDGIPGFIETI